MQDLNHQARDLGRKIHLYTTRKRYSDQGRVHDSPTLWRKQDFIAEVLLNAEEQKYYAPSKITLEEIRYEFEKEKGVDINLDALFEKYWLRLVLGIVHLPAAISGAIHSVKKVQGCKNELQFLMSIKEKHGGTLGEQEFNQSVAQYQQETFEILNIPMATNAHLISVANGKVSINNTGYYALLLDHWNEFIFLAFVYDKFNGQHNHLIISKCKLYAIYSDHARKYSLTPALSEISSQGLAHETPEGYVIDLFRSRYCTNETLEEAGAVLWRKLKTAYPNLSKDGLLLKWLRKIKVEDSSYDDIQKYFKRDETEEFSKAAASVIMGEPDLKICDEEYKKTMLDYYMGRDLMTVEMTERLPMKGFSRESTDAYDTMEAISNAQRWVIDDYLYFEHSCRCRISYLVGQIVKSYSCSDNPEIIYELVDNVYEKPYLTWTLLFVIWNLNPELIPILMTSVPITAALFSIVKKLEITEDVFESPAAVRLKLTSALFKHILDILQLDSKATATQKAKVIFDCLVTCIVAQYKIKGQHPRHQREFQNDSRKLADDVKLQFKDRPVQSQAYGLARNTKKRYYASLLPEIFDKVRQMNGGSRYTNGVLDFPYAKIDMLLFLAKLSKDLGSEDAQTKLSSYDLAHLLLECYLNTITATSITSTDFLEGKPKEVVPIFLPAVQNITAVDWGALFLLLEDENLVSQFLNPCNLNFNSTGDKYDDYNRFIMHKLRGHLRVLIMSYRQLVKQEGELKQKGLQIGSLLTKLSIAILDIAVPYSKNEVSKNRYDIFNDLDERPSFGNRETELIPDLGAVSNYFPPADREKLIRSLLRNDIIVRLLKLADVMESEQDQVLLLNILNEVDLQAELDKISSFNDFQFLLTMMARYTQYQDKARLVLKYWEQKIAPKKERFLSNEAEATTYRTKLLLAFHQNNLNAIEEVPEPVGDIYMNNSKRLNIRNEKDFYRALYYYKNNSPEKAYALFNELVHNRDDDTTTVALNRFASKVRWAEKESDITIRNTLFSQALDEWDIFQKNLPADNSLDSIVESLRYNRLIALDALGKYDEFDNRYAGLNHIERVKQGFLEIGVKNKLARRMTPEAIDLVKEAIEFHRLKDGTIPEFVREMNKIVTESQDPEALKNFFSSVLAANPEGLVKLIPDSVNDGVDTNSYILNEIVSTACNILSKINTVSQVSYEDKYSDLMIMGLNGSMKFLHWHVANTRGGYSDSNLDNPGEIDFSIFASNNQELAICEALNLRGQNNYEVQKHAVKIFNYTPSKQGLFLIVYYKGLEQGYLTSWGKYQNSIKNIVEFPPSYALVQDSFTDLSYKYANAAIRVGITEHGSGIKLHHVFLNMNYKAV